MELLGLICPQTGVRFEMQLLGLVCPQTGVRFEMQLLGVNFSPII